MSRISDLISQIDAFIRKYYTNQIIRGVLLFLIIFALSFLLVAVLEYFGRFNSFVRATLFFGFILINLLILIKYIIIPVAKLFSFGKRINRFQAAKIIGKFFPDVQDKLLNTLQLNESNTENSHSYELVKASVEQNAERLSPFRFASAVDFKENIKYLKYGGPIFLLMLIIGIWSPNLFKDGTERLFKYNQTFVAPAPFNFLLDETNPIIEQGDNYTFSVQLESKEDDNSIPDRVYLVSDRGRFLMNRQEDNTFTYQLDKIKNPIGFSFSAIGYSSNNYNLEVVGKTGISSFEVKITPPKYLDEEQQVINNPSDIVVPEGSIVEWNGRTKNTSELTITLKDTLVSFTSAGFRYADVIKSSTPIKFFLKNEGLNKRDSLEFQVNVIKDDYPSVKIEDEIDSLNKNIRKLSGLASDDIGLTNVTFYYEIQKPTGETVKESKRIPNISGTRSSFNFNFNIDKLGLKSDDKLTYYFKVWDNDGVNGSKSVSSQKLYFTAPSKEELVEQRNQSKDDAQKELDKLIEDSKNFNERLDQFKMDLLNTPNPSYNELQELEKLNEQRKNLEDRIQNMNEQLNESLKDKQQFEDLDDDFLEDQMELEQLLNDLMDDELKDLLEQLEEMMKNQDFENMQEHLEEADQKAEDRKKQLDRTKEMLKRMDVDERIDQMEESLEDLAKKQEELREDINEGDIDVESAKQKQEELNEKFDNLEKKMEELLEKNEDLKRPYDLEDLQKDSDEIDEKMEGAKDDLDKGDKKDAQEKQKDASEKMEEMASKMNAQKKKGKQDQAAEDMASLQRLLSNIIHQSFNQEETLDATKQSNTYGPEFRVRGREQRDIIDNNRVIEDSLLALADRIPQISSFVNKELATINKSFRNLIDDIDERRKRELLIKQQTVLTSLNNLALFLNESLENMQQQMQGDQEGEGSCDNPGGQGKGKEGEEGDDGEQLQDMKEMLKQQLEDMKKGNQPGGKEQGEGNQIKLPFGSKEAAKMAAQQKAMRQKLEEMREKLNKDGSGSGEELNDLLKELEDQQENLVNKKWDQEMIKRQKEILTRLLESEKALEERGWDEERESISGKNEDFGNQIEFLEYKKKKEKQIELLRTLDPAFNKYYKDRASDYFNAIN